MTSEAEREVTNILFKEAVRMANNSDVRANRYRTISIGAIEAMLEAIELIKCGRIMEARTRLERALVACNRMSQP
ncbi:MAG: hypothetical protein EHM67_03535 [Hyphomicrobiaceae bacterium]|nr:MAG: hypothetical protein EHM67_03535 [Hyphomicrobiaceae bacterium]